MATPPPMIVSIASLYSNCIRSFDYLCHLVEKNSSEFSDQISLLALQDELGRFRVWAGNAAAHRTGRISLDHKLRESTAIHATVANLIRDLDVALREVIALVSHVRDPAPEWASDSSDSSLNSGSESEPEDPMPLTTELEERFLEVRHIITCLYKLSIVIQNPASRDRLQRCAKIEVGHFEYFDVAHASQKFPFAEQYLVDRLGGANTKRRQLFQYHEQHHDKLALYIDTPIGPDLDPQDPQADNLEGRVESDSDMAVKIECPTLVTIAKTVNTQTTVSTFVERSATAPEGSDDGRSQTSYATSVGDDSNTKLRIPAPPNEFNGEPFECPYCFSMTAVENSRSWIKHVFRDLRPYLCTFQDCPKPGRLYQSRHDWFDHEVEFHRREWFCNACSEILPTRAQFMRHLTATHPEIDPGKQSEGVVDRCERAIQSAQPCPICHIEYLPHQLQSHLGRHMQQLAIFALPKNTYEADDEGEDEDEEGTVDSILGSFESHPDHAIGLKENPSPLTEAEFSDPANSNQKDDITLVVDDTGDGERLFTPAPPSSLPSNLHDPGDSVAQTTVEQAGQQHRNTEILPPVPIADGPEAEQPQHKNPLVSKEHCLSMFERYIDNQKPGLRAFYNDRDSLVAKAAEALVILERLGREGCDMEWAFDFLKLSLYDLVIVTDDSTSMSPYQWPIINILNIITTATDIIYHDGISMAQFLSNPRRMINLTNSMVESYVSASSYMGMSRIATELHLKFLNPCALNNVMDRPLLVIVLAHGASEGKPATRLPDVLLSCVESLRKRDPALTDAIAVQFLTINDTSEGDLYYGTLQLRPDMKVLFDFLPGSDVLEMIEEPNLKWLFLAKFLLGSIDKVWNAFPGLE